MPRRQKKSIRKKMPWDSDDSDADEGGEKQAAEWWEKPSVLYANDGQPGSSSSSPIVAKFTRPKGLAKSAPAQMRHVQWTAIQRTNLPPLDLMRTDSEVSLNWAEKKLLRITDTESDNYVNSLIECSFNFPRVSNQLKRLMGTNVVRLTDRKYMVDLRKRIQEDCAELQAKRIENREDIEAEREMNLILKGYYTPENCPPKLIIVHSIALAAEMERQRNLIMQEGTVRCPPEYDKHPVFVANQKTNAIIANRRSKLKTIRELNSERLIRLGNKWERERFKYDEIDRLKVEELREKRRLAKEMEQAYNDSNAVRGMDLLRIKNRDYIECEFELKEFLDNERDKMLNRFRKKPDIKGSRSQVKSSKMTIYSQLSPSQAAMSEQSTMQNLTGDKSATSKISSKSKTKANLPAEMMVASKSYTSGDESKTQPTPITSNRQPAGIDFAETQDSLSIMDEAEPTGQEMTEEEHMEMLRNQREKCLQDGYMLPKPEFDHLHYEDPRVTELKRTDTVQEMYHMADEIICSLYDPNNLKVEEVEEKDA